MRRGRRSKQQLSFGFPAEEERLTRRELRVTKLSWVLALLLGQEPLKRIRKEPSQAPPPAGGEQPEA